MSRLLDRPKRHLASIRLALAATALILALGCGEDPVTPAPVLPEPPPDPVLVWLAANAHPFTGPHLSLPHTELEFLREFVGDARIVALGENTLSATYFEMKASNLQSRVRRLRPRRSHRGILRALFVERVLPAVPPRPSRSGCEEMGFNTFAIEATWPEARRIDHYVRTGEGDPERLLSGLYFWTWNTESVLEMIEWMREHNQAGGDVGFTVLTCSTRGWRCTTSASTGCAVWIPMLRLFPSNSDAPEIRAAPGRRSNRSFANADGARSRATQTSRIPTGRRVSRRSKRLVIPCFRSVKNTRLRPAKMPSRWRYRACGSPCSST